MVRLRYKYVYDEYLDVVICPEYKSLLYSTTNRKGYREYKSLRYQCETCQTRHLCTESRNCQKTVTRHIWEEYIEQAEDIRHSPKGKESYCLRSQTIERVFADAKEKYGMRYTPYRGLRRVSMWVRPKYAAMNLKKLAVWKWKAAYRQFFVTMNIVAFEKNLCSAAVYKIIPRPRLPLSSAPLQPHP